MRILFGIQGTGNGHLSRCHRLATELQNLNVEVDYLISGREPSRLFNSDVFGDYLHRRGLTFITERGQLRPFKTLMHNSLRQFMNEVRHLDVSSYDVVVSDFEPVTAWAAKRANKRCIGIGRQYAFREPSLYQRLRPWHRKLIDYFAPADEWLGMHWQPMGNCLPPVVRHHQQSTAFAKQVLVYLPFEDLYQVIDALLPFSDHSFSVFHPDIKKAKYFASDHVMGFPPSRETFAEQLALASGVIANAGFETTCEALNQGKQLAVKPLNGQFEQQWNAKLLQQDDKAHVLSHVNERAIGQWLELSAAQPAPAAVQWSDVASSVANWLATGAKQSKQELRDTLWSGSPGWIRTNDTWINSPPL